MDWPGEKLLIKLWETLAEKGVGGLLKPWQMKREAKAQLEMRRLEIVALADAEREAAEIREGRLAPEGSRYVLALPQPEGSSKRERPAMDAESRPPLEIATAAVIGDALRREVNVAKAIGHAESELREDPQPPPQGELGADWLYRWRDYAGAVSSDELQSLWGRLLAGELKSPGLYSYRTLEFIRNLSLEEAKRIERLAGFVINDFITRGQKDLLDSEGVHFKELLDMQDLGVISGVEALGLTRSFHSSEKNRFVAVLCSHERVLLAKHDDPNKELKLNVYSVTSLGQQVMRLGSFRPHEAYLRAVGEELKKQGVSVSIASYRDVSDGQIQFFGEEGL